MYIKDGKIYPFNERMRGILPYWFLRWYMKRRTLKVIKRNSHCELVSVEKHNKEVHITIKEKQNG